ncbi:MAG TPA: glycosyltransferase [Alphaproteobacteria bacterium]
MTGRVFIHVQHLLGSGHARRTAAIGAALAARGFDVEIASGGPPVPGLTTGDAHLFQLPPLRARDASFKTLIDENGRPVDDTWRAMRRDRLLACCRAHRPDVVVTELFPFGRRGLEFELLPLIDLVRSMRPRPLILCSLRDVLVAPRDPEKTERTIRRARDWFDGILVHGDPRLIELPASYPAAQALADRITYTGYVASPPCAEAPSGDGAGEVLVSAGGGAVGARLFSAALSARQAGAAAGRAWRLLLGSDLPAADRARLIADAGPGLVVEPARPDFVSLLRRCHVSVSQAGYNTAVDLMETNARAVLVPFASEGETEQTQRALALQARGWAELVAEAELSPQHLAAAIDRAATQPPPALNTLNCAGALETARTIERLMSRAALP